MNSWKKLRLTGQLQERRVKQVNHRDRRTILSFYQLNLQIQTCNAITAVKCNLWCPGKYDSAFCFCLPSFRSSLIDWRWRTGLNFVGDGLRPSWLPVSLLSKRWWLVSTQLGFCLVWVWQFILSIVSPTLLSYLQHITCLVELPFSRLLFFVTAKPQLYYHCYSVTTLQR